MAEIDKTLYQRTATLCQMFDQASADLLRKNDHRVFFTWAHGYITKKIYKHINLFNLPNELMKLNNIFATVYLDAINGSPHEGWLRAFKVCDGLMDARKAGFVENAAFATGSFEVCAACMAKIHISVDLKNALMQVKVDTEDYGNILVFVNEGHLYAEKMLRGQARAALMVMLQTPIMMNLNMNAETWRNTAYKEATGISVGKPTEKFKIAYSQAEGR